MRWVTSWMLFYAVCKVVGHICRETEDMGYRKCAIREKGGLLTLSGDTYDFRRLSLVTKICPSVNHTKKVLFALQSSVTNHAIPVVLLDVAYHSVLYQLRIHLHPGVMVYPKDQPIHQAADR